MYSPLQRVVLARGNTLVASQGKETTINSREDVFVAIAVHLFFFFFMPFSRPKPVIGCLKFSSVEGIIPS